jgi:hypothetical protein
MADRRSVMIRRYKMSGSVHELMRKVDAQFARQLDAMNAASSSAPVQVPSGILSYQAVQTGEDTLLTITVFASAAHLERAQQRAQDIRKSLSEFDVEEVETVSGVVMISRTDERALEPVWP